MRNLIIAGTGDYADMAYFYLSKTGLYNIKAFCEEKGFIKKPNFHDLPIVSLEEILETKDTSDLFFVAIGPNKINTVRERIYKIVCSSGFSCIKYIHPDAHVWSDEAIGINSFIFPKCVVEPHGTVGENCVMWSGSVLCHHSHLGSHCFMAPGATVSGRVTINRNCFIGINSTVRDKVSVANHCIIGGGALIKNNTEPYGVYSKQGTRLYNLKSMETKV